MKNRVMVTGGAGYIGSHTVLKLLQAGCHVCVIDNLYSGHAWAVPEEAAFLHLDIHDREGISRAMVDHEIDSVIHFAGHIVVPESVQNPSKYFHNNVLGSLNLIECCIDHQVNRFVFSSSAAVYGIPGSRQVHETGKLCPINPYGRSKLMTEWMLEDFARSVKGFRYAALRYFNVAGANMQGRLGQSTANATHLIKLASEAAYGLRSSLSIFGDDYDTPDGTCIRDYIHVDDLADAHLKALDYIETRNQDITLNCGYGRGYSVKEVIDCVKSVSGRDFPVNIEARRPGDPPQLIANSDRIRNLVKWVPRHNNLETICQSAIDWEARLLGGTPERFSISDLEPLQL
ncbi:MAG: UDP-glucose 4-epimerase GalE [Gammaproteobacteria bacterium]|nr:UDP-glucose 4-epimerase GalE [Gammaproteobacteria bacterium]